ncbi:Unknown protein [Striga hermonthica]|uniref:Uncharacterized protein n=1 Tax=Striga hermonthica TaxID=68872 RepID=A0A9N7ND71_STRHE|nr:Unknown protein [Striga hermonthica]
MGIFLSLPVYSKEIRIKIRLIWERRRKNMMVQQACLHEWQNLIALAAKRGLSGEKELKEWSLSIEQRKKLKVQETCHHEWQNLIALAAKKDPSGEKEVQWDSNQILKMTMRNLSHARSKEIRIKMRLIWERRRKNMMVQQACLHEWQNLIALAAKRGFSGEKELKEWSLSIEQRKKLKVQETCHYEWQNLIALAAKKGLSGEKEVQWDSNQILKMTMRNPRHARR